MVISTALEFCSKSMPSGKSKKILEVLKLNSLNQVLLNADDVNLLNSNALYSRPVKKLS